MSSPKIILGIDPGLARLGWGIVSLKDQRLEPVSYGTITTSAQWSSAERFLHLHIELKSIVSKHQPDLVAIEKLFFGKNAKTAMVVGEARGVILLTVSQAQLPINEYTPAEVKIALTGYGSADKHQIQQMVRRFLNLDAVPHPDDTADALAVAITEAVTWKNEANKNQ